MYRKAAIATYRGHDIGHTWWYTIVLHWLVHEKSRKKETDYNRDEAVPRDQQVEQHCIEQAQAGRAGDNHDHDHKDDGDHNHDDHKDDCDIVEDESSHGGGCEKEYENVVSKD